MKNGCMIFNMYNDLSERYVHEGEKGTTESAQVLTRKMVS